METALSYPRWPEIRARHIAARRAQAIAAARAAAAAVAPLGVPVLVFGSLAEDRFGRDSDLDLALDGPADAELAATGAAFLAAHADALRVDVVWLPGVAASLRNRIESTSRDPAGLA